MLLAAVLAVTFGAGADGRPALPPGSFARKPWLSRKGVRFYVDPASNAANQADAWRESRPADAALMDELAREPVALWVSGGDAPFMVRMRIGQCFEARAVPVVVLYNTPGVGKNSKETDAIATAYARWSAGIAEAVGVRAVVFIFEPDALGNMDGVPEAQRPARYAMFANAVKTLSRSRSADVYIDAGHSGWLSVPEAVQRLKLAGIENACGFALNVSNFQRTQDCLEYGRKISAEVGGKHFVIDTGRNGNGPLPPEQNRDGAGQYNPPGRALGERPTTKTGEPLCDAFLWVKPPGESDAAIHGGPPSGQWWADYALGLVKNARLNAKAAKAAAAAQPPPPAPPAPAK